MKVRLKNKPMSTLDRIREAKADPRAVLVAERGLRNTRRNRRWIALVHLLGHQLNDGQEKCEALAWAIINTWESTP